MAPTPTPFVVLKFGGTSVSSADNWRRIGAVLQSRLAEGLHPVVVPSALSGITDRLEGLLALPAGTGFAAGLAAIEAPHRRLSEALGMPLPAGVRRHLDELGQIVAGIALVNELSDRVRARVMASGELMATELGAAWLATQGFDVEWIDARTVLRAEDRRGAAAAASVLSATCGFAPDAALQHRFAHRGRVFLSQGFIASDSAGHTVLLGRGGSDTSGAYFAAKLSAQRLEVWTDVPGMFSANPKLVPNARLLKQLHYDEAQEIASSGAKVLHPRCILPVKQYGIPLYVYATQSPALFEGTHVSASPLGGDAAQVKAIAIKKGITLVSMDSPGMWHQVGFLADAFQIFKEHGLSVDLVSTSETNVTVSLDPQANTLNSAALAALSTALAGLCRTQLIGPCAAVSLLGRNIRGILHDLGEALALFEEHRIYLVSQAANDLNFTFVIDQAQGDRLVSQLHELLPRGGANDLVLGPTWEQLHSPVESRAPAVPWWRGERARLLERFGARDAAFVYDLGTVRSAAAELRALRSVAHVHYAMKANPHAELLRTLAAAGIGFDCVSRGEIEHLLREVPGLDRARIIFTPNFAPRAEYQWALERQFRLTLDNLHLRCASGRSCSAAGNCWCASTPAAATATTRTCARPAPTASSACRCSRSRNLSGWPIPPARASSACTRTPAAAISASTTGSRSPRCWPASPGAFRTSRCSTSAAGALGVPDKASRLPVDVAALDRALLEFRARAPRFGALARAEGRYLVAAAGVLLARGTQLKEQGRGPVRRRRDRHELADPPGAVWRAPRHRQSDAPR